MKCRPAALLLLLLALALAASSQETAPAFAFRPGDRVAWVGSSSTNLGVWPRTMEFLLRTRHPELGLTFKKFSTGGGTFATGLQNLDKWLADYQPTVVFLNYGGNDAGAGEKGLAAFKSNMEQCVAKARKAGARVVLMPPQAADVRKSGEEPAARRRLYADTLLACAKEKGWPAVDIHRPLEALQKGGQQEDETYTILTDKIHLTAPAYVAWGYFLYDGLNVPGGDSRVTLRADGRVLDEVNAVVSELKAKDGGLSFVRRDEVLPILPPNPLPPRKFVPLEKRSPYLLRVVDIKDGVYQIRCEGQALGDVSAARLRDGVNLNSLLLDSGQAPPWAGLAKQLWEGKALDQVGKTRRRFEVVPK